MKLIFAAVSSVLLVSSALGAPKPPPKPQTFTITGLTAQEAMMIQQAIAEAPYKYVAPLEDKLKTQLQAQARPKKK